MPFLCAECGNPTLAITSAIELPADRRSDEIALQLVACARCGFRAVAVYEESRRGSFDSEAVDHAGYRVTAETLDSIAAQIAACPDPRKTACDCASHRRLGRADDSGRWCGLPETAGWFPMRVSPAR
jgi:hypothetical protein